MRARADAAADTYERVLAAGESLFKSSHYDDVTLQAVSERAGVALKTVLRRFGSKDALLVACARSGSERESTIRAVKSGDWRAAAAVLASRYESTCDEVARYWPLEDRIPAVATAFASARQSHRAWLADVFASNLPRRGTARYEQRLAELFGATEIFVWFTWRRRLGIGRKTAERALAELLEALMFLWARSNNRERQR